MILMANTFSQIYIQTVFAVSGRLSLIRPEFKEGLFKYITGIVRNNGHKMISINGMPDHVHVLLKIPATICAADMANKFKGVSSRFANDQLSMPHLFRWQEGYGAFSVSRSHVKRVRDYIQNQKRHHAEGTSWPEWEETFQE